MNFFDVHLHETQGILTLNSKNFKLAVPEHLSTRFSKAKDRDVILGIRPEHISDMKIKEPLCGGEVLQATIEVVKPIGSEVILLASCGSDQLTARVDSKTKAKPNMEMELQLDMNYIQLFDPVTKEAY